MELPELHSQVIYSHFVNNSTFQGVRPSKYKKLHDSLTSDHVTELPVLACQKWLGLTLEML